MNIKLIVLKGKKDYMQTSFLDVLQADLILVTHQFLTNTSYKGRTAKNPGRNLSHFFPPCLCADTPLSACKDFVEKCPKGDWALTWCHFHRVIVDEFHEISDKDGSTRAQFRLMQGDTMWGLTGTPRFESTATIMEFAEFLNMNVNSWRNETVEAVRFIQHRVRRNDPDIKLPDPVFETIKVTQTVLEAAFYKSCANLGTEALLKLCSHYQIGNEAGGIGDYEAMPIKQVTEMVQSSRAKSIVKLEREVDEVRKEQARLMRKLGSETAPSKRDILADRMTRLRRELEKSEVQLALTRSQFNYFSNFVDSYLKAAEKVECNICLDEDVEGDIGIIPCGHAFCFPCANDVVKSHGLCPNCRQTVSAADVMKVPGPAKAKEAGTVFEEAQTSEQSNAQEGDGTLDPDLVCLTYLIY
ncbi:hypothetical protein BC830DRAFT_672 [Chytriomyces sp. MP71]|nr:hypothetical protein BC830DRAFT_672 [Chytriomyces sp. MP71]